ncbi:MAG: DnaJ domain-containing protein [Burkholderiaceae bacterium]|nr:DnaJ domain-containing protein [Burkholderiaceae bacterium]
MEFKDYYATLGVDKTATADEIKKAYRKLARKYHPDVSKEADAAERMSAINEANTVLSDPEKRAAYDALGRRPPGQEFRPPPDWDAGFEFSGGEFGAGEEEFSDFFANLFGRGARARRGPHEASIRGGDHHAKVMIDLADSYHGARRAVTLRSARLDAAGHVVTDERVLEVTIPKGVRAGQHIRLRGQGAAGLGGGSAGDLYLEIEFRADERYQIDGRDVTQRVSVAPWEAALGAAIEVPTPSGPVQVTVPAGSRNGRKLRLRGRGIPGEPPGDLYLELELVLPPASTEAARELYRTMEREMKFNPRTERGR